MLSRSSGAAALAAAASLATLAIPAGTARAGGYDTPMLYSARHLGMGGTAIAYVDDPSAVAHNPAGLARTARLSLTADISLLLARTHASPTTAARDIDSRLTVAPVFLLGAAYRLTPWLTFGAGIYPIALAGAQYSYQVGTTPEDNSTRLVFLEGSPALALNLLEGRLMVGAGYRITYANVHRFQGVPSGEAAFLDFTMSGWNLTGFRLGAAWRALDWLQLGAVYRHKTETTVRNQRGVALFEEFTDISTVFVLPSKLGVGARADYGAFGLAVDGEYTLNSQNTAHPLVGTPPPSAATPNPTPIPVPNIFNWSDEITLRAGVEYRLADMPWLRSRRLALRAGYVYDGKTTNPAFPSAFGTPPGSSQIGTAGLGVSGERWQVNIAYAYRTGSGRVREQDVSTPEAQACRFCSTWGNDPYRLSVHGIYADVGFSY